MPTAPYTYIHTEPTHIQTTFTANRPLVSTYRPHTYRPHIEITFTASIIEFILSQISGQLIIQHATITDVYSYSMLDRSGHTEFYRLLEWIQLVM